MSLIKETNQCLFYASKKQNKYIFLNQRFSKMTSNGPYSIKLTLDHFAFARG